MVAMIFLIIFCGGGKGGIALEEVVHYVRGNERAMHKGGLPLPNMLPFSSFVF